MLPLALLPLAADALLLMLLGSVGASIASFVTMSLKLVSPMRLVQTKRDKRKGTFTMFSPRCSEALILNKYGASLIKELSISNGNIQQFLRSFRSKKFLDLLIETGYLRDISHGNEYHILDPAKTPFPLTALSIELTNVCNLNCKHCYGSYGHNHNKVFFPLEWILNAIPKLDDLHTYKVALTGGEATLHPHFAMIADIFLNAGFDLTIFTNGTNPTLIKSFLKCHKDFYFTVKVSLDGTEKVHNIIRNDNVAFKKVTETLDCLSESRNVKLFISSVVMKENIDNFSKLERYIFKHYPNAIWTKDLVFPSGNARVDSSCSFSAEEFDTVFEKMPELFTQTKGRKLFVKRNRFRCTGGISQATLTPDGYLKICNAASSRIFYFSNNVFESSLLNAWENCGANISRFRQELVFSPIMCHKCTLKGFCTVTNCRVLADAYTGSPSACNPISCFAAKVGKNR